MKECEDKALAYGEVTGHVHRAVAKTAKVYETDDGGRILECPDGTDVVHEEHDAVSVPAGKYVSSIVREFDPFEEEIRQVRD